MKETKIYKKKSEEILLYHSLISKLKISPKLFEIGDTIKSSVITIVRSDTGSGKTIGIPYYLSREKWCGKIFCSVPTVAATISSYNYQQQICNKKYIGYACEGNINYNHQSKIIYCTAGHLMNKMIHTLSNKMTASETKSELTSIYKSAKWFCSILILDEFHVRNKESDICLCLWIYSYKMWLQNKKLPKPPKLIIMSATLDNEIFTFGTDCKTDDQQSKKVTEFPKLNLLPVKPSILSYAIKSFPIEIIFDEESQQYSAESDERYFRAAKIAYEYHTNCYNGHYLIFVPGKVEIDTVIDHLINLFGFSYNSDINILAAHSELPIEELMAIHDNSNKIKRKIIVATNVAECSITIENVSLVIDTLTHKIATSGIDESIQLKLEWISKSSSMQRKGRTGRTCCGTYIVLQSEEFYTSLLENIVPELTRNSISYNILNLMNCGLDPKIILAPIINEQYVQTYIKLLDYLEFIEKITFNFRSYYDVTSKGMFCSHFPLDIRKSAIVYHICESRDPDLFMYLCIICTVSCFGSGIFYFPKRKQDQSYLEHGFQNEEILNDIREKYEGYSDIDTIINVWVHMLQNINIFYLTDVKKYCQINHLNFKRIKDSILLLKKCITICKNMGIIINYHFESFYKPPIKILSFNFFHLLSMTHQEYITTMTQSYGKTIILCCNLEHKIYNRHIHTMKLKPNQIYYSLVRSQNSSHNKSVRFINVIHGISEDK